MRGNFTLLPNLVLSPRHSEDTDALEQTAREVGWQISRLDSWRAPAELAEQSDLAIYGEALFVRVIADQLPYVLLEASPEWLAKLPDQYQGREIQAMTLGEAMGITHPAF